MNHDTLIVALDNIDRMLKQIDDTVNAALHSDKKKIKISFKPSYKIERQINPLEYMCS